MLHKLIRKFFKTADTIGNDKHNKKYETLYFFIRFDVYDKDSGVELMVRFWKDVFTEL